MSLRDDVTELRTKLRRIDLILMNWESKGYVLASRIQRVLEGKYNWYVTFHHTSTAHGINVDSYATISGVSSQEEAEEVAKQSFGNLVFKVIPEWDFNPKVYPKGEAIQIGSWSDDDKDSVKA